MSVWTLSLRRIFRDYFSKYLSATTTEIPNQANASEHTKEISWVTVSREKKFSVNKYKDVIAPLIVCIYAFLSLLFNLMCFTMRNWALACWTRLSCSDWLMLVKMPASGLKCNTLPWRFVRKWPKLRMQHTRTTHWTAQRKQDIKEEHERMQKTLHVNYTSL